MEDLSESVERALINLKKIRNLCAYDIPLSLKKMCGKLFFSQVQARWKYEDQIKRPYFHMKPLERGQLKNWNEYLDFEIKNQEGGGSKKSKTKKDGDDDSSERATVVKDDELIQVLFERCLIACALYEEFWIKYANWLREKNVAGSKVEQIRYR